MLQLLAGLTIAFFGYVLYEVFKSVSSQTSSETPSIKAEPAAKLEPVTKAEPATKVATAPKVEPAVKAEPAAKMEPAPKAEPKEAAAAIATGPKIVEEAPGEEKGGLLRNPATGETSVPPTNYRFAKKWIKEALVAEGLLDKVYKNAELDEENSRKVKEALDKLKIMDAYQG